MGDITQLINFAGNSIYFFQALEALFGAFCVLVVWRRILQVRFPSDEAQGEFLTQVETSLSAGDFASASKLCEGDDRAVPALITLAIAHRSLGIAKVRELVAERFQRDVLVDIEFRMTWVYAVIKSAPMLGLLGTVLGMMAAFGKLGSGEKVEASQLASDISLALVTTFVGLTIAIPLSMCATGLEIRLRRMQEQVAHGLTRFFEAFRATSSRN